MVKKYYEGCEACKECKKNGAKYCSECGKKL